MAEPRIEEIEFIEEIDDGAQNANPGENIGEWNAHLFTVNSTVIRGFTNLTVKASCETKDKKKNKQAFVQWKKANANEVTLEVVLNAFAGCSPREEAMAFLEDARNGADGYFYVGGEKLMTCKLMLTQADISEIVMTPGGIWTSAKVKLTMKQSSKADGTGGTSTPNSSGKKKKKSKKKKNPTSGTKTPDTSNIKTDDGKWIDPVTGRVRPDRPPYISPYALG